MRMIDSILMELEQEAGTTQKILERTPEAKLSWRPHPKSMTLGQLAFHIASVQGTIAQMSTVDAFEIPSFTQPEPASKKEILDAHAHSIAQAKELLAPKDDAWMMSTWAATRGGTQVMALPRVGLLRAIMLNHVYHHRGQLSVYLRLLGESVPSVYGPTADENPLA